MKYGEEKEKENQRLTKERVRRIRERGTGIIRPLWSSSELAITGYWGECGMGCSRGRGCDDVWSTKRTVPIKEAVNLERC